jgi:hypothetical protein
MEILKRKQTKALLMLFFSISKQREHGYIKKLKYKSEAKKVNIKLSI